jgi:hypothetical protein
MRRKERRPVTGEDHVVKHQLDDHSQYNRQGSWKELARWHKVTKVEAALTNVILAHVSHVSQNAMVEDCHRRLVGVGGSAIQVKPM